jgi:hypothetical protein
MNDAQHCRRHPEAAVLAKCTVCLEGVCKSCWRSTEDVPVICIACYSQREANAAIPPWFQRVRWVALLLGACAFVGMSVTERAEWAWSLMAPWFCVAIGWSLDRHGVWSRWRWWRELYRARALVPAAVQGTAVTVRGRIHCEKPVVSKLGRRVCAAYLDRLLDKPTVLIGANPRQVTGVGSGLSIELSDGERIALERGTWRLLDPFGRGALVAEARIDDGDDVVVRGQVASRPEAGGDYRTLHERLALLPAGRLGLVAPAAGRYQKDRIEIQARFPTWRWVLLLGVALAPGVLARPLRKALRGAPKSAEPSESRADVGGRCGPERTCVEGAYCNARAPNTGFCVAYCHSDDECPEGKQCGPRGRCVTEVQKRAGEGEDCSKQKCARGLTCGIDFAREPAPGSAVEVSCYRRCSVDTDCGTGQRCTGVWPNHPLGLCMSTDQESPLQHALEDSKRKLEAEMREAGTPLPSVP